MRLCLDEHYSAQIAADLRDLGHDVQCVKERPDLVGLSDSDLLEVITHERRALLTENVGDFAPLIQRRLAAGEPCFGIIYTSGEAMPRSRNTIGVYVRALDDLLRRHTGDDAFLNRTEWLAPAGAD